MNNKEIGKLIATLRKQKNMTQQDLGDKLGVGFRAVSKWERGINFPDIGLINDLCEILGITTDELFKGKLNSENKTKTKKKLSLSIKISLSIIGVLLVIIPVTFMYLNNKTYNLLSENREDYVIEGQMIFKNNKYTIIINKIFFKDKKLTTTKIKNYEYKVTSNDEYLFGFGYALDGSVVEGNPTIETTLEKLKIYYENKTSLRKKDIIDKRIILTINFIDENNQLIKKEIPIELCVAK